MALNPKLNIYVVSLNPKDKDSAPTYRDLFKAKYFANAETSDYELLNRFFEEFLNTVGKTDFRKDNKSKKVIGVSEYNPENESASINILHDRCVIEGLIDGGQYGILRAYADVDNKTQKTALGTNKAVLDKFYISLCTPLNSNHGFLFVQSYTEATIQEPISSFITDLLKYEDGFYNVCIEPFVPKKFIEKFKRDSKVRMFSYRSKIGISDIMRDEKKLVKGQAFEIEISIKPCEEDFCPGSEEVIAVAEQLAKKKFDDTDLADYKDKIVYIQNGSGHNAHYDIEKEIKSIRPTIYLKDEGVEIDEETGQPNFAQIKRFTLMLLDEVKQEYNSHEEIEEL